MAVSEHSERIVAVLGASPKPGRYSNMAVVRLLQKGFRVIPVNPAYSEVEGVKTVYGPKEASTAAGKKGIDTLTLYLAPHHLDKMTEEIVQSRPSRVIFNPGSESFKLMEALDSAGIPWLEACTLVLLSTGQF